MLSVGIDYHKRFSQMAVVDETGRRCGGGRVPNDFSRVEEFIGSLGKPCRAVIEAGWGWGVMYDWLSQLEAVKEVQLAHPYRTRAIAAAQIKTDSIDAHTLAQLLRADLIPRAYMPGRETRRLRDVVRQRLFLVRLRTMVKNRVHALLEKYHVALPPMADAFGKVGRTFLKEVELPAAGRQILDQDLRLLEVLSQEIRQTEAELKVEFADDRRMELLTSIPGIGLLLGAVIALEIDDIRRFPTAKKLIAYAGLAPTTYASGDRSRHGKLLPQCNKWLRWALVEAAWIAVRRSPYFRTQFGLRVRQKGSKTAIIAVARRLLEIVWCVLTENRPYEARPATKERRSTPSSTFPVALEQD